MIRVTSRNQEPIDAMVRRFKKLTVKEGVMKQIQRSAYYEKPSDRQRAKKKKSANRQQLLTRENGQATFHAY